MITCSNCGTEQTEGNFCESCGTKLTASNQQAIPEATGKAATYTENTQTNPNPTLEKVKKESGLYWNYFLARLKNPGLSFRDDDSTLNSTIITAILLPLAVAVFLYAIINNVWKQDIDFFSSGRSLPFFPIVIRVFFVALVVFFTGLLANFITFKIAKNTLSFKQQFVRYTGLLVPYTAFFVVFATLALAGIIKINLTYPEENIWMFLVLNLILIGITFINPILHTFYHLLQQKHKQNFYFSLLSLLFNIIILAILTRLFIEGILTSLEDRFDIYL
ncbi:zinc ribbon domain-containing protein [Gracilibacillus saliphilus]|uniref:zinc ribbon domain-containing protein n=1 Tax=Gracilibacillus saliphilus TaxID=543890 RepID=UPI0013D42FC2|nr:zinc ribbon domain-containing protein [Gracilibacillus saliphilus]